jgi:DNA-directed RNA polymerase subunit K/omega
MKGTMSINNFLKVLITAQRAKQIQKGAHPLVQNPNTRATRIALDEVELGLIGIELLPLDLDLSSRHAYRDDSRQDGDSQTNREATNKLSSGRIVD